MDCLNSGEKKNATNYQNFDIENLQADQQTPRAGASQQHSSSSSGGSKRRCCSIPALLGIAALLFSIVALILSIYATVAAKKVGGTSVNGMFLTTDPQSVPQGWKAVNLFKGTGYFAKQENMLYPRSDHKSIPIGSNVYLLGGLTNALEKQASEGNETATAAAEEGGPPVPLVLNATVGYDTFTQTSTKLADMPQPRYRHCGTELNGQLYVIGGVAAFEPATAEYHIVSDRAMRFTPATNKWEVLPGRLNHPRSDCCAAAVNGNVYVAGGWNTNYTDTLGSVEVFDPATGAWSFTTNLTQPRGDCEAVALDDRTIVVLGGVDPAFTFLSSVEAMNVTAAEPKWAARAPMNKARGDFAAEALPGGRIIVMGGETTNGTATEFALYDVEEYMHSSNRWVNKAPLPEARFRFDTAHVVMGSNDRVLTFGGAPSCSGKRDSTKEDCVAVALDTVWGYFDEQYPDTYVAVKQP